MAHSTVQVTVQDFAKWRSTFEKYESVRAAAGVTNPRIYRGADNGNQVAVVFDVADKAKAQDLVGSAQFRSIMQEAGVVGPPSVAFHD